MKSFATELEIAATPEAIWAVLTDAAAYPSWNETVTRVDGTIAPRQKITVHSTASPGRAFPLRVATFEPQRRMVWSSGMPLGLFKGERVFTLTPNGTKTSFRMQEQFTGLFAPLITKSIPDLQPSFDRFAQCLKARVEKP